MGLLTVLYYRIGTANKRKSHKTNIETAHIECGSGVTWVTLAALITLLNYDLKQQGTSGEGGVMARKRENMTPLEIEARSHSFRRMLKEQLGCECVNCGSSENVEYHHIVPLALGGTNDIRNLVPLCYKCHKAAHHGRHITSFADHSHSDDGRPPKCDDETAFNALDLLLGGQIGTRKCKEMMNLSAGTKLGDIAQYKRWLESRGLTSVRNNLDVRITNSGARLLRGGDCIGEVISADGEKRYILFNDTGLNDDTVYKLRHTDEELTFGELKAVAAADWKKAHVIPMNIRSSPISSDAFLRGMKAM